MADNISDEIPETVLRNFAQIMVRNLEPAFSIEAEEALTFEKKKETHFKNVKFREFDRTGTVITEGRADSGIMFDDTEDVELRGGIFFRSEKEKASLEGDYLFWNNEESTLKGQSDSITKITEDSGSGMEGRGFFADSRTKTISFDGDVSGSWIDE